MIRAQIITPPDLGDEIVALLEHDPTVTNLVRYPGAAMRPPGDVIVVDMAREEASAVIRGIERTGVLEHGAISLSETSVERSAGGDRAAKAAHGLASDAVLWEEVEERTSASAELSGVFLGLLTVAVLIAAIALLTESVILMIGGMVVGPEFGPLAGIVAGVINGRRELARRSLVALAAGIPVAVVAALILVAFLRAVGYAPDAYVPETNVLAPLVTVPDWTAFLIALLAGIAGILAISTAHAGALVGVLVSVATVPAMAGMGTSLAYGDLTDAANALLQLGANLLTIVAAGLLTLGAQRALFARRYRRRHGSGPGSGN